jgi:hypothetical protein
MRAWCPYGRVRHRPWLETDAGSVAVSDARVGMRAGSAGPWLETCGRLRVHIQCISHTSNTRAHIHPMHSTPTHAHTGPSLETIFERNSVASDWESTGRTSPRDLVPADWDNLASLSPPLPERSPGTPRPACRAASVAPECAAAHSRGSLRRIAGAASGA